MSEKKFSVDPEKLKQRLSEEEYRVTQEAGTEPAFSGKYWDEHADGRYTCKVCGQVLFDSEHKFDSGAGWPSFDRAVPGSVEMRPDDSHGMSRTEVVCSRCGAHLGHVFDDGPSKTTGQRFCINSASLDLKHNSNKNNSMTPEVDAYIANVPEVARPRFDELRALVRDLLPEANEVLSYGIIGYKIDDKRARVFISGWKDHLGVYPIPKDEALRAELAPYIKGKGTLWFPLGSPLPKVLVKKVIKALAS